MFAKSALCLAALTALSIVSGQSASAAVITISAPTADGIIQNVNQGPATGEGDMRVGLLGGSNFRVVILMFQLPVLAAGETVTNAVLNTRFGNTSNTPLFNIDVYATRVAAGSPNIDNGLDWGFGASPGGTLIQNDLVTPSTDLSSGNTLISTDATGNANLLSYVNTNYVAGSYVYLRLNPDVAQDSVAIGGSDSGYRVFSADIFSGARVAQLELTTVIPEPTMLGLVGLAATLGLARRRRA